MSIGDDDNPWWLGCRSVMESALPRDLRSLTGLRFYAALAVLLRHSVEPIFPAPILHQLATIGPIGVGIFFVLSGFVLTWSTRPETGRDEFWFNRFARIYPLHILLTVAAVAIAVGEGAQNWAAVIASLFLVQSWLSDRFRDGGNGVSWSLSCEAFFYAIFPIIAPRVARWPAKKALRAVPLIFAAMVVYTAFYAVVLKNGYWFAEALSIYTNPAYRLGEFVIGICLAVAVRHGFRVRFGPRLVLAACAAVYALLGGLNWGVAQAGLKVGGESGLPLGVLDLMYLPFAALLVLALASSDLEGSPTGISGRWHMKLGQWSFALYLVQMIVIEPMVNHMRPDEMSDPARAASLLATLVACIVASAALHEWFEAPANLRLRLSWRNCRQARSVETTPAAP